MPKTRTATAKSKAVTTNGKPRKKRKKTPELLARLRAHFGTDPSRLPVVEQTFQDYDRANLHLTIEDVLAGGYDLHGIVPRFDYNSINLPKLSHAETAHEYKRG